MCFNLVENGGLFAGSSTCADRFVSPGFFFFFESRMCKILYFGKDAAHTHLNTNPLQTFIHLFLC